MTVGISFFDTVNCGPAPWARSVTVERWNWGWAPFLPNADARALAQTGSVASEPIFMTEVKGLFYGQVGGALNYLPMPAYYDWRDGTIAVGGDSNKYELINAGTPANSDPATNSGEWAAYSGSEPAEVTWFPYQNQFLLRRTWFLALPPQWTWRAGVICRSNTVAYRNWSGATPPDVDPADSEHSTCWEHVSTSGQDVEWKDYRFCNTEYAVGDLVVSGYYSSGSVIYTAAYRCTAAVTIPVPPTDAYHPSVDTAHWEPYGFNRKAYGQRSSDQDYVARYLTWTSQVKFSDPDDIELGSTSRIYTMDGDSGEVSIDTEADPSEIQLFQLPTDYHDAPYGGYDDITVEFTAAWGTVYTAKPRDYIWPAAIASPTRAVITTTDQEWEATIAIGYTKTTFGWNNGVKTSTLSIDAMEYDVTVLQKVTLSGGNDFDAQTEAVCAEALAYDLSGITQYPNGRTCRIDLHGVGYEVATAGVGFGEWSPCVLTQPSWGGYNRLIEITKAGFHCERPFAISTNETPQYFGPPPCGGDDTDFTLGPSDETGTMYVVTCPADWPPP